jgi:hypothetical protein
MMPNSFAAETMRPEDIARYITISFHCSAFPEQNMAQGQRDGAPGHPMAGRGQPESIGPRAGFRADLYMVSLLKLKTASTTYPRCLAHRDSAKGKYHDVIGWITRHSMEFQFSTKERRRKPRTDPEDFFPFLAREFDKRILDCRCFEPRYLESLTDDNYHGWTKTRG